MIHLEQFTKNRLTCYSSATKAFDSPIDLFSINRKQENSKPLKKTTANIVKSNLDEATIGSWLPLAAEQYKLSPKLEDYICIPVVIMPSDLPNRNGISFPYSSLVSFNPNPYVKRVAFKTWEGSPTFYEHDNEDYTKAKGVIFAVTMSPIVGAEGDVHKVICLCGFDRTKDENLYNRIKSGDLTTYSMGAFCDNYSCSVCGTKYDQGGCEHLQGANFINNPVFKTFPTRYGNKLAYYQAEGITGFETSAVEDPAYVSAQNSFLI